MVQQGLKGFGHDIKSLRKDMLEEHICNLLGPKFDQNGWKFRLHTTLELQEVIVNLYMCVYEKEEVLNDTITLEFARGLVVENNGMSLNWVAYALTTHKK
jgi:hypothetical protein